MKTLYDMSTGKIIETPGKPQRQIPSLDESIQQLTELRLREMVIEKPTSRGITPDLALADPDRFLDGMN